MFLEETKVCNYADDTTIYACGPKIETVIAHLEHDALKITEWFPNNLMKPNDDKCHLMVFGSRGGNEITIKIGEACAKESTGRKSSRYHFRSITFFQRTCQDPV